MSSNSFDLRRERVAQRLHAREQLMNEFLRGGDVHGGRERVVRRLRHVHVVVGVDRLLASPCAPPAISMARFEITSFTFMFVCVPLPVCQTRSGKWSSSLPAITSSAALRDEVGLVGGEQPEVAVDERRGLLERAEAADDGPRHGVGADGEVRERAGRLRAVVAIRGHANRPHAVGFGAVLRHRRIPAVRVKGSAGIVESKAQRHRYSVVR